MIISLLLVCPHCQKTIDPGKFRLTWDLNVDENFMFIPEGEKNALLAGFFLSLNGELKKGVGCCPDCLGMAKMKDLSESDLLG